MLRAYKVELVQQLKPGENVKRKRFAEEMLSRIEYDADFMKKKNVVRRGYIPCLRQSSWTQCQDLGYWNPHIVKEHMDDNAEVNVGCGLMYNQVTGLSFCQ
jgi:hypothetical protein